jgi:excisionase family DNA binding protein
MTDIPSFDKLQKIVYLSEVTVINHDSHREAIQGVRMDELMTIKEFADYVRRPVATVYQWNSRGEGPRYIKRGRMVLYRRADVDVWLSEGYVNPAEAV